MNITFFIGNGFDLNIGLKTKYSDFYPFFLNSPGNNMIKEWINEDEKNWSDLEKKLGESLSKVTPDKLDAFLSDMDDMILLLSRYLGQQESEVGEERIKSMNGEFLRSLKEFGKGIPVGYRNEIDKIKSEYKDEEFRYQFISFNYTKVLDRIVLLAKKSGAVSTHPSSKGITTKELIGNVHHIHGTIGMDMLVGVNDVNQIGNKDLRGNNDLLQSVVKQRMNQKSGNNRINDAGEIISNSHIICIYGMSLGETDGIWWDRLVEWVRSPQNRLIIYAHTDDMSVINCSIGKKNRESSKIKDKLLRRRNISPDEYNALEARIFVVFEPDIFKFPSDIER